MSKTYEQFPAENQEFGRRLEKLMYDRKIKSSTLARLMYLSAPCIHKWKYGRSVPRIDMFAMIVKLLDLTPDEVMHLLAAFTEKHDDASK